MITWNKHYIPWLLVKSSWLFTPDNSGLGIVVLDNVVVTGVWLTIRWGGAASKESTWFCCPPATTAYPDTGGGGVVDGGDLEFDNTSSPLLDEWFSNEFIITELQQKQWSPDITKEQKEIWAFYFQVVFNLRHFTCAQCQGIPYDAQFRVFVPL